MIKTFFFHTFLFPKDSVRNFEDNVCNSVSFCGKFKMFLYPVRGRNKLYVNGEGMARGGGLYGKEVLRELNRIRDKRA